MNESAFPIQRHRDENGYEYDPISFGMTLRDYFAAKAMQGILACPTHHGNMSAGIAGESYLIADAMLKARGKAEGRAS